ncbi:MAG: hypothetical protein EBY22_01000 [Gammaproteobacteria bacterium]|jgi:hypothetical protein|nr:hypothetical protein [Gammaproteobacteria bacterium]
MDSKNNPFALSEIAEATQKLGSALSVMHGRQPDGPCGTYIGPVNNVSEVACRDKNGPQAATIDTTAGGMLSDLKAGTFNKKPVADSSQKPVVPSISPSTEEDAADESSSRRLGS